MRLLKYNRKTIINTNTFLNFILSTLTLHKLKKTNIGSTRYKMFIKCSLNPGTVVHIEFVFKINKNESTKVTNLYKYLFFIKSTASALS